MSYQLLKRGCLATLVTRSLLLVLVGSAPRVLKLALGCVCLGLSLCESTLTPPCPCSATYSHPDNIVDSAVTLSLCSCNLSASASCSVPGSCQAFEPLPCSEAGGGALLCPLAGRCAAVPVRLSLCGCPLAGRRAAVLRALPSLCLQTLGLRGRLCRSSLFLFVDTLVLPPPAFTPGLPTLSVEVRTSGSARLP